MKYGHHSPFYATFVSRLRDILTSPIERMTITNSCMPQSEKKQVQQHCKECKKKTTVLV